MKERPLLFSAPMVLESLSDRKTKTRRMVKPQPDEVIDGQPNDPRRDYVHEIEPIHCPYGVPGDRLWVKETFRIRGGDEYAYQRRIEDVIYRADVTGFEQETWKPSIFMWRWASRLTLEITDVRVERLNDISDADAIAEGISEVPFVPDEGFPRSLGYMVGPNDGKTVLHPTPVGAYRALWESINGAGSWAANPWVWVITFRKLSSGGI